MLGCMQQQQQQQPQEQQLQLRQQLTECFDGMSGHHISANASACMMA
jgi:hypothetical protein